MSTGLVIMTINQLISETKKTKGLKDRKKQRYLRDLEKLKLEYEKIEVPEYFSKQYNQLNGKGKELIKDMKMGRNIQDIENTIPIYIRYLKASLRDEVVGKYFDLGLTSGGVLTKDNISVSGKASLIQSGYILYSMKDLETYPNGLVTGDHLNIVVASSSDGNKYVKTIENVPVASVHMEENVITGIEVYVTPEAAQLIAFAQANGDVSVGLLPLDYKNTNIEILDGGGFISSQSETNENTSAE